MHQEVHPFYVSLLFGYGNIYGSYNELAYIMSKFWRKIKNLNKNSQDLPIFEFSLFLISNNEVENH